MDITRREYRAQDVASRADVETRESYQERIHYYENRNFSYIPMPADGEYYNVDEGLLETINESQYIEDDTHLLDVLEKMQRERFLLIDLEPNFYLVHEKGEPYLKNIFDDKPEKDLPSNTNLYTPEELQDVHPDLASRETRDYGDRYMIITLADLNKRRIREILYVVFAELASSLSNKIEQEYPESEELLKHLRADTIGRWKKETLKGLNLHVSEHLNLVDMLQIIQASDDDFVEKCGFESKNDVQSLSQINDIRNHVMHANRSLIYERNEIENVLTAVNEARRILDNMN